MMRTNSKIVFAGLDTIPNSSGAQLRFDLYDEDESFVGTFPIIIGAQPEGTVDAVIAKGFERISNLLEHMSKEAEKFSEHYAKSGESKS